MPYPTLPVLDTLFSALSSPTTRSIFFDRVADDVEWTILGTNILSGTYTSKADFLKNALGRINGVLKSEGGLEIQVVRIVGGGTEWAAAELKASQEWFMYNQVYTWWIRFDENGKIVQARAYYDGNLLNKALEQNE